MGQKFELIELKLHIDYLRNTFAKKKLTNIHNFLKSQSIAIIFKMKVSYLINISTILTFIKFVLN